MPRKPAASTTKATTPNTPAAAATPPRIALVLQGGGALGAYQAGVYQALHEANIEPDWVSGVSIGASDPKAILTFPLLNDPNG